jgi:hypothetical protein
MKFYYRIRNRIKQIFSQPEQIPSYEVKREILKEYQGKYKLRTFVETGTFMGDTVDYFKDQFSEVISIELAADLAQKAKKRFDGVKNVTIIQGDSAQVLKKIVKNRKEPILFWLDGHYSSEFFVGDVFIKTAKTDVDTPVVDELKTILECNTDHIILVDDARLFVGLNDYPSISQVKKIVRKSGKKYAVKVELDIIRITPKKP